MIDIDSYLRKFETIKSSRSKWESTREDIKKYVCPQADSQSKIFDSTSIWAREQLASGLQSLLVNQSSRWFTIDLLPSLHQNHEEDITKSAEVTEWCNYVQEKLLAVFNYAGSNFFSQVHEFFLTLSAFGTAVFYIEEDPNLPFFTFFKNISLDECYFEEDRFGLVRSVYRKFKMSPQNAQEKWDKFKELVKKNITDEREILHVVTKNTDKKGQHAYSSIYIDLEDNKELSESGYSYFPFMVARWIKNEGEAYGYSPAHFVMADIKLLNQLREIVLQVGQKQINPPLLVPKQGYNLPLQLIPGAINFYQGGIADKITPLLNMENIFATHEVQQRCQETIMKAFYVDIFRMQEGGKEMTATEAQYRNDERMSMMSPIVGRIETEFLNPLIQGVFSSLSKYGMIPELIVNNQRLNPSIEIEYVSSLVKAQKSSQIIAIEQAIGFMQRMGVQNFFPEIFDNLNWDEILKLSLDMRGAPNGILNSEEQVNKIRRERQLRMMQTQGNA